MSDTHTATTREYVVVETVIDCDGWCNDGFTRPTSTISWEGLPPRLVELFEGDKNDLFASPVEKVKS